MPIERQAQQAVISNDALSKLMANMDYGKEPPIVADIVSDYPPEYQHPEETVIGLRKAFTLTVDVRGVSIFPPPTEAEAAILVAAIAMSLRNE